MPTEEVKSILPGVADSWEEDEVDELRREANRQKRILDIENNVDKTLLDKKMGTLPATGHLENSPPEGMASAKGEQQRAKGEEVERTRWIMSKELEAFKHLAGRCAMGRQASTRQHARHGRRVQVYVETCAGSLGCEAMEICRFP